MLKKIKHIIKDYIPVPCGILFVFFVIAIIINVISVNSASFSDFYSENIGCALRNVLAYITNLIPFSLAETIIIALPVIVFLLIFFGFRQIKKGKAEGYRYIAVLLSVLSALYSVFVLGFGTAYNGSTIEEKLGLDRENVSASELYYTAEILLEKIDGLVDEVDFSYSSSSVMPYSLNKMVSLLNDTYGEICEKYDFITKLESNVKFVALSEPMTYTHISGVYTYYTGEANININFPDYDLPFTAAHEMAHQRGIAREDEANFMAFLVCISCSDPYIQYSGYMNTFEYVYSALYKADKELYSELSQKIDMRLKNEMIAYNEFFAKYKESTASSVSSAVNDTYLKLQGQTEGSKSYGRVVDLTVAYYKSERTENEN